MTLKQTGPPENPDVTRWQGGFSWVGHPDEALQRASHALTFADGTWLIDPLDFDGLEGHVPGVSEITGVVVLSPLHSRDASDIAARHDVSVHVPAWMDRIEKKLTAPIERFEETLAGTDYRSLQVYDLPFWHECALYDGETLVVPESVGTAFHFRLPNEQLGIHPLVGPFPPRQQLGGLEPERVLTGHGLGTFTRGATALTDALGNARVRAPLVYYDALRQILSR